MFDELDKQNPIPQPPLPGRASTPVVHKTEDIFSEVDKTVKPEALRPRDNNSSPVTTVIPADDSWLKNKVLIIGLILGGLIIVIGGSYLGLKLMVKDNTPVNIEDNNQIAPEAPIAPEITAPEAEEVNNVINQPIQPTVTQPADSDFDGLTDEEEMQLGTNIYTPDTDGDGLTDREEIKVYGTNSLMADTDGDGYPDGDEVKNGFNPNGSGKLLDINNQ